jgi:hypothetical protein
LTNNAGVSLPELCCVSGWTYIAVGISDRDLVAGA